MSTGFRFTFGRAHPAGTMDLVFLELVQIVVVRITVNVIHLLCDPLFTDCCMDIPLATFTS